MLKDVPIEALRATGQVDLARIELASLKRVYWGYLFRRGTIVSDAGLWLPAVDGLTAVAAFATHLAHKYEPLLKADPPAGAEIADTLFLGGGTNYFHFMVNWFPSLMFAALFAKQERLKIAMANPLPESVEPTFAAMAAEAAGGRPTERLLVGSGTFPIRNVAVAPLVDTPTAVYFHRTVTLPHLMRADTGRAHFGDLTPRRLFVRRTARQRTLVNEDEVAAWYAARGFTVVDPGALPLAAQAATFHRADIIVGVEGAGMTNLVFAANAKLVVVLSSPTTKSDPFFSECVAPFGVTFRRVLGKLLETEVVSRHANFVVPIADLETFHAIDPALAL